jgi:hypothetical protein
MSGNEALTTGMETPLKIVTRGQQLAEHHYDGDLAGDVAFMRARGASWRVIAAHVNPKFNRRASVTYQSLINWYGDIPPSP